MKIKSLNWNVIVHVWAWQIDPKVYYYIIIIIIILSPNGGDC